MNDWFEAEQLIERAHEHYEHGRWEEAETALREALALNPYRPEWHFNLGLTLEAAGRYAEAARAFKDCYALESDDPQVLLAIGLNLLRCDEVRESIEWFEKAYKADPRNTQSLVRRIEAYTLLGEHEQAEVMFYLSQQQDPHNAEALAAMADSLLARKLTDKAVWCLREAAGYDPSLPGIHSKLAHAYAATGRLERARQLYLRELRSDPGDIDTLLDLGELLAEMNRLGEAGEKFRRVLELEPDNIDAHFQLAELARRENNLTAALEHFDIVLRLDATFPGARRRLAMMLLSAPDAGVREQSSLRVRELLDAELKDVDQEWEHAAGARDQGRPGERGVPAVRAAEDLHELAQVLLDAGRAADAKRVLSRLLQTSTTDIEAMHLFAVACFALGTANDRAAGIEACRGVLRLDPRFVPAIHNMAVAYTQMRQWNRARYWVRQGLRLEPDDAALKRLRMRLRLCVFADLWAGAVFIARALNPMRPERPMHT